MRQSNLLVAILVVLLAACNGSGESDLEQQLNDSDNAAGPGGGACKAGPTSRKRDEADARAYYDDHVYPLMQSDCMDCHVAGGDASDTAFVLDGDADGDYPLVKEFTERQVAGYPYLLAKASGFAGHTGGVRFGLSSAEADILIEFSELLAGKAPGDGDGDDTPLGDEPVGCTDDDDTANDPVAGTGEFLKGVALLSPEETLHKAAMLMLGRRATSGEVAAVSDGSNASLRATLRGMMQGSEFTEFLMTSANDQLLTNKFASGTPFIRNSSDISYYRQAAIDWPGIMPEPHYSIDDFYNEDLATEPLALIAYIVNNERDYREVVQADYTVFNSRTYEFFDVNQDGYVALVDPDTGGPAAAPSDTDDWVAGRFALGIGTGLYRDTAGTAHPSPVYYPHAGVLTTKPWLARWPNTNTNGQRKRAKKVLHQFLGYNIELTANRPMNADALNDPDNPTFKNPACTACHYQLDAVAGTFQNWGYNGNFRLNAPFVTGFGDYLREDALNAGYKTDTTADCGNPLGDGGYCDGDLWYADRFPTGFVFQGESDITEMPNDGPGGSGPHDDATLRWLADQIVADARFPTGTVKFWYEGVFNEKPLNSPVEGDPNYDAKIRAYIAQQEMIQQVADVFVRDNGHGAYNLKDLLVELFASAWFRAVSIEDAGGREVELANVGMGTLLTPEQLERKIESTLGVRWRLPDENLTVRDAFTYIFNVMYGGIDSDTVNDRTRQVNPLMMSVIKRMISEMACEAVYRDFIDDWGGPNYSDPMALRPASERLLFGGYNGGTVANENEIKQVLVHMHRLLWNDGATVGSSEVQESYEVFAAFWDYETNDSVENMRCASNTYTDVVPVDGGGDPVYSPVAMRVWRDMLVFFMSDAQFLHE